MTQCFGIGTEMEYQVSILQHASDQLRFLPRNYPAAIANSGEHAGTRQDGKVIWKNAEFTEFDHGKKSIGLISSFSYKAVHSPANLPKQLDASATRELGGLCERDSGRPEPTLLALLLRLVAKHLEHKRLSFTNCG
ncbi:MAG: hypothetical protein KF892_24085 [Rhizobacter sp.]|nr:hypothetical protein [Rhizobacter sp.]